MLVVLNDAVRKAKVPVFGRMPTTEGGTASHPHDRALLREKMDVSR